MNEVKEIKKVNIEDMIFEIRGVQVILDSDLARLYECVNGTKDLNKAVKRNEERFPESFMFQLSDKEYDNLRFQIGTSKVRGGRRYNPYVFTEQGVAMLSSVLHSEIAIKMSIQIINAFVAMRHYIGNSLIEQRFINDLVLEDHKTISKNTNDIKLLQESFKKFEEKKKINDIYFNGQIYDAYYTVLQIFNNAKKELVIVDTYADNTLLDIVKRLKVKVILITKDNSLLTRQDITRYNKQYNNLKIIYNNTFHDRYFILDKKTIYHCGTSINRIGYKTFCINKISDKEAYMLLINRIYKIIN